MEHIIRLIEFTGYWGYGILFLIVFFESFPPTLFLPGDSLLFTAGFLASLGYFDMTALVGTLFAASVLGYIFSFSMGKKLRDFIIESNDKYWFKKKHIRYTEDFYRKYGTKALIMGRFVPVVRSFSPALAGTVDMDYRKFIQYTCIGGFLWTGGVTSLGFYLGKAIPSSKEFLTPIILVIIIVSLLPSLLEYIMAKRNNVTD